MNPCQPMLSTVFSILIASIVLALLLKIIAAFREEIKVVKRE